MRQIEPDQPGAASHEEERLRKENQDLRRQLQELKSRAHSTSENDLPAHVWRPSGITIAALLLTAVVLLVVAFFAGYIPLQKQRDLIISEAHEQETALPRVDVIKVGRSSNHSELQLPGSIQAITEAPILARTDGYILRRLADIGDRVKAGQPLAEIDAPEMDEQIRQAKANVAQAEAGVDQALANYKRGEADTELARVTAQRFAGLAKQGVISRQDDDRNQAQYQSLVAGMQALEKAIAVQRSNVAAAEANVARLERIQGYRVVKAPFDGVITLRNVDVGALVTTGNTLLFRIAQVGTLRTYLNVPQDHASSVRPGQAARLTVSNLPGRSFKGSVARTANALDPASRTLLVEVHVPNPDGALFPGMYAQVDLISDRTNVPLLIPGDALIVRAEGTNVAVVRDDHTVHLQAIEVGRDYGDRLEVLSGLKQGDLIIQNPGDVAREGLKVEPVAVSEKESDAAPNNAGK
jgi:RND family efflux transporter MFP subunit